MINVKVNIFFILMSKSWQILFSLQHFRRLRTYFFILNSELGINGLLLEIIGGFQNTRLFFSFEKQKMPPPPLLSTHAYQNLDHKLYIYLISSHFKSFFYFKLLLVYCLYWMNNTDYSLSLHDYISLKFFVAKWTWYL